VIVRLITYTQGLALRTFSAKRFAREGGRFTIIDKDNVSHVFPIGVGDFEVYDESPSHSSMPGDQHGSQAPIV
jgi:hypothetical protein